MTREYLPIEVADGEILARFILCSKWIRNSDNTVKQDAFIPYPHPNLSVTRHLNLADAAIWEIGQSVANIRQKSLIGRADFHAAAAKKLQLKIESAPVHNNPYHANITGWPEAKHEQKMIAQQLAAVVAYHEKT